MTDTASDHCNVCAKCGRELSMAAKRCIYCGAIRGRQCPKCKAILPVEATVCMHCKTQIPDSTPNYVGGTTEISSHKSEASKPPLKERQAPKNRAVKLAVAFVLFLVLCAAAVVLYQALAVKPDFGTQNQDSRPITRRPTPVQPKRRPKPSLPPKPIAKPLLTPQPKGWTKETRRVNVATSQGEQAKEITYYKNSFGMEFAKIPAGEFMMGSSQSAETVIRLNGGRNGGYKDEHPQHRVKITRPFYMGVYEVTQEQYQQIIGKNPSHLRGAKNPVEQVSWSDAIEFCRKLSQSDGATYRLPTEAEWEYACRAGTTTPFHTGLTISTDQANYNGNVYGKGRKGAYRKKATAVGSFTPNAFGLYDMHGNVWEWCQDWYGSGYYKNTPIFDPAGPQSSSHRVCRSGSWYNYPGDCRSTHRSRRRPIDRVVYIGFRVVCVMKSESSTKAVPSPKIATTTDASGSAFLRCPANAAKVKEAQQAAAKASGVPMIKELALGSGVKMKFALIPAGEFLMGSNNGRDDEKPVHRVTITKPFYMGMHEVTQEQYEAVMGKNPSKFKGTRNPVERISWNDAVEFCRKLSQRGGATYRLPTEAEWEYACRAGTTTRFCFDNDSGLGDYAWYRSNSGNKTHPVGEKKANAFGLYDMHGNVWEWCQDWYDKDYYKNSPTLEASGPRSGSCRVFRGGSWIGYPWRCRSAYRLGFRPDYRDSDFGFRVVCVMKSESSIKTVPNPKTVTTKDASNAAFLRCPANAAKVKETQRVAANALGAGATKAINLGGGVKIKFVLIPAGEFMMGSPASEEKRESDEGPVHRVKITQAFYMGVYEVTQEQYQQIMGKNPSHFKGARNPVERVSWNDAVEFCRKLSQRDGATYRLPTEAEWEYVCRAGTTTPFHTGATISTDRANYDGDYTYGNGRKGIDRQKTIAVGSFAPNAFGLYDMHGNVWEWCQDWYDSSYYKNSPTSEASGPRSGSDRVLRGGSWRDIPGGCRSANRGRRRPDNRGSRLGFRLVRTR